MEDLERTDAMASRKALKRPAIGRDAFQEHGKLPPQAIDLEEAVLGALMLEKDAVAAVIDMLVPAVFYKESHQSIFEAISNLFHNNEPVDILTVTNSLRQSGKLELAGGAFYITQLTSRIASSANIEFHVGILKQKFLKALAAFVVIVSFVCLAYSYVDLQTNSITLNQLSMNN